MKKESAKSRLIVFRDQIDIIDRAIFHAILHRYRYLQDNIVLAENNDWLKHEHHLYIPKVFWQKISDLAIFALNIKPIGGAKSILAEPATNNSLIFLESVIKAMGVNLISLLYMRAQVSLEIGMHKINKKMLVIDNDRWQNVKKIKIQESIIYNLPENKIIEFWENVHQFSCYVQMNTKIFNKI
ncbi:MAG: chorismate mutase [SAR324 cluster bacterium]|nr:chorismate mutase [SAR324 cluster bacterium]